MQKDLKTTALNSWHKEHGGQMVEFAGWEMPVAYQGAFPKSISAQGDMGACSIFPIWDAS